MGEKFNIMRVDVELVLEQKAPKLAKKLPRFLVRYLKRIVHQDEINEMLSQYGHLDPINFIRQALAYMGVSYRIEGLENIHEGERYLFASNHPFGGMDGLMLAEKISSKLGDVRSISNDILMAVEPLRPIFLPVNKHGRQSREAARIFDECFASDVPIQTFPAGLCSRKIKGEIVDLEWKTNFVKKAIQHKRNVVPVYVEGRLSNFFYNLSNIRTRLGIKANVEMLYLVNEMFKQKGKEFCLTIGKPIPYTLLEEMGSAHKASEYVRAASYAMAKNVEQK